MLGREVDLPIDLMCGLPPSETAQETAEFVKNLRRRFDSAHEQARQCWKQQSQYNKAYYDTRVKGHTFEVGDVVWRRDHTRKVGVSPKLAPKWRGPFLVIQKFDVTFEIQIGASKSLVVHYEALKHCHSTNLPRWLKSARKLLK